MLKKIGELEIAESSHAALNTTEEVVVCRNLLNSTEEETATQLALQGAIPVSYTHLDVYKRQVVCFL